MYILSLFNCYLLPKVPDFNYVVSTGSSNIHISVCSKKYIFRHMIKNRPVPKAIPENNAYDVYYQFQCFL